MTVQVEREGPRKPHRCERRIDCTHCGSLLKYMFPDDVQRAGFKTSGFFFSGTAKIEQLDYIDCGHCGAPVFL